MKDERAIMKSMNRRKSFNSDVYSEWSKDMSRYWTYWIQSVPMVLCSFVCSFVRRFCAAGRMFTLSTIVGWKGVHTFHDRGLEGSLPTITNEAISKGTSSSIFGYYRSDSGKLISFRDHAWHRNK
jgi:hypothetical protein